MEDTKFLELVEFLKELRDQRDELEEKAKGLSAEIESIQDEVIAYMAENECATINHKGFNFSLIVKEYPAAVPEQKDELYRAMRERGFGYLFTINSQTLGATLKELKADNENVMPDWLDGLVKIGEKSTIRISKGRRV